MFRVVTPFIIIITNAEGLEDERSFCNRIKREKRIKMGIFNDN